MPALDFIARVGRRVSRRLPVAAVLLSSGLLAPALVRAQDVLGVVPGTPPEGSTPHLINVQITLDRTVLPGDDVYVSWETVDLGPPEASAGIDFSYHYDQVHFAPGVQSAVVQVEILGDDEWEPDEKFGIQLSSPIGNSVIGPSGYADVTIRNDDKIKVTVYGPPGPVSEGSGSFPIDIDIYPPAPFPFTITHGTQGVGGGAQPGQDFVALGPAPHGFNVGEYWLPVWVDLIDDTQVEPAEQMEFWVTSSHPDVVVVGSPHPVTIDDDDVSGPTATLSILDAQATEGDPPAVNLLVFPVVLSEPVGHDVHFDVQSFGTGGGAPATLNTDYRPAGPTFKTIPAGQTMSEVKIDVLPDSLNEGSEFFTVTIYTSDVSLGQDTAQGEIFDDDTDPIVEIGDVAMAEGPSGSTTLFEFPVFFDQPTQSPVTLTWRTRLDAGANASPDDFQDSGSTISVIPGGVSSGTLAVQVYGDDQVEPDEIFRVELVSADGAQIGPRSIGTAVIENDDAPILSVFGSEVAEGPAGTDTVLSFELVLSEDPPGPVTVSYSMLHLSTDSSDVVLADGTIVMTSRSRFVDVTVRGDNDFEGDEEFKLDLVNVVGAVPDPAHDQAKGIILDDDSATGPPAISIADVQELEGQAGTTAFRFTVQVSGDNSQSAIVFDVSTQDGSATSGAAGAADYAPFTSTLTIPASAPMVQFTVEVSGDLVEESDEFFRVFLTNPVGAVVVDGEAKGIIQNDDSAAGPVVIGVSIDDVSVSEGDAGTREIAVPVRLSAPPEPGGVVIVEVATVAGTALAGEDFESVSGEQLVFGPGETVIPARVSVRGDLAVEPDESFLVVIASVEGGDLVDGEAEVILVNDDAETVLPKVAIADVSQAEGDSGATVFSFEVRLSRLGDEPVSVPWETVDGSAVAADGDYQAGSGVLEFGGETRKTIEVRVAGDEAAEPDEEFFVVLGSPVNALLGSGQGRGLIRNDDGSAGGDGLARLAVGDARVIEGDGATTNAVVEVTLVGGAQAAGPVEVEYHTLDGSARVGENDYRAREGRLVFPQGVDRLEFNLQVVGDQIREPDESFYVELSNPLNATISRSIGAVTIVDDDGSGDGADPGDPDQGAMLDLVAPERVPEHGRVAVQVRLEGNPASAVSAELRTEPMSAKAGEDFEARTIQLRWSPGQTGERPARIAVIDDLRVEERESFRLVLRSLTPGVGVRRGTAIVHIIDNDHGVRLVAEETELSGKVGKKLTLEAKVLDEENRAVAGAEVRFEGSDNVKLTSGKAVRSDREGRVEQVLRLGTRPGRAQVVALLAGTDKKIVFEIKIEGGLQELFAPGRKDEGQSGVAETLDGACIDAQGEMEEVCDYLYSLDEDKQRKAVEAMTPTTTTAQGEIALRMQRVQVQNVAARQAQLRGGARAQAFDQLGISVQGQALTVGALRNGVRSYRDEDAAMAAKVDRAVEELIAKDESQDPDSREPAPRRVPERMVESPWGFFANGRIAIGKAERTTLQPGYDLSTLGVTAGVDYRLNRRSWVGAALGYSDSDTQIEGGVGDLKSRGFMLSLYSGFQHERFFLDGAASYGKLDLDVWREIRLPETFAGTANWRATGDTESEQIGLNLNLGYDFSTGRLGVTGFTRGLYGRAEVAGYRESGARALAASYEDQVAETMLGEIGAEIAYPISMDWGALFPLVRLSYLHEFSDGLRVIGGTFVFDPAGGRFEVLREEPDRDYFNLGLGMQFTLKRSKLLYFMFDTDLLRDDFSLYTLTFGYRQQF